MDCMLETGKYKDFYPRIPGRTKGAHRARFLKNKENPAHAKEMASLRVFYSRELNLRAKTGDQDAIKQLETAGRSIEPTVITLL